MEILNRLYSRYGKRTVVWTGVVLVIFLVVILFVFRGGGKVTNNNAETASELFVQTSTVGALSSETSFSVVGTVEAVTEAQLQAEAGGRITRVFVSLGDTVRAGTILASIENSRESATLLQAEGAYEAALAASLQSGVSLDEARTGARNAYRDAFSTADGVLKNTVDSVFSKTGTNANGFRLAGSGEAASYIEARNTLAGHIDAWSKKVTTGSVGDEAVLLNEAETILLELSNLAVRISPLLLDTEIGGGLSSAEKSVLATQFANARASVDGALSSVSRARESLEQAKLSAVSPTTSQANAQLKTALGSLRSAQANYEKTLVRTPISGVVNALYVKEGTYITQGAPAAIVANNGALEITTALSEEDQGSVREGDVVRINGNATGTITHVAPAIDPVSGKIEVRIGVDAGTTLKNGSTVNVTFTQMTTSIQESNEILVPLSALKLLASGPIAFTIDETQKLVARPVELGAIRGESVVVMSGLTRDDVIVVDARGLREGDVVTITQ